MGLVTANARPNLAAVHGSESLSTGTPEATADEERDVDNHGCGAAMPER
jgi:hypothetical protein